MSKIGFAIKWSGITEITAKLVTPITNMILARLLNPEMFGVVATLTMVISLADVFSDAGFQKYLIYKEFENEEELHKNANVAFWTNFAVSVFLWLMICAFSKSITSFVGSEGLEKELMIICVSLPLTSFSSIQTALYRRNMDFKTLFLVRVLSMCVPVLVTIPCAFFLRSYWALIIGTIVTNLVNAFVLTVKSRWKPKIYYSYRLLKSMLSFSTWTLMEQIILWLTSYADIFIVGRVLSSYWLGIYKTSMTTADQIMNIIVATVTPVMFSALSRVQADETKFKEMFLSFQRKFAVLVVPLGIGIFLYRDFVTYILLGSQWSVAADFIGCWALAGAIVVILAKCCGEAFRSKGKPWISCVVQILSLASILTVVLFYVNTTFTKLAYARTFVRIVIAVFNLIALQLFVKISVWEVLKSMIGPLLASVPMIVVAAACHMGSTHIMWQLFSILACIVVYFAALFMFPSMRKMIFELDFVKKITSKFRRSHDTKL